MSGKPYFTEDPERKNVFHLTGESGLTVKFSGSRVFLINRYDDVLAVLTPEEAIGFGMIARLAVLAKHGITVEP